MTKATLTPPPAAIPPEASIPQPLTGGLSLSALTALFWLTLRQHCRARRLLVLAVLFMLPGMIAVLIRSVDRPPPVEQIEFPVVLVLIANLLVPFTALLYSSGMILDEIEEQTLTYLMVRPLPKWGIYVSKLLATMIVTVALASVFTYATYVVIYWGTPGFWREILATRAPKAVCLMALALVGYCSLFGCISLVVRWPLVIGVIYTMIFEGWLANIDFVVRRLTVMYYFRDLTERWLTVPQGMQQLDLAVAPGSRECVVTLLLGSLVLTGVAAFLFTVREFHMKTPEGS
jgi:ABC-2 type transport system permease protein